MNYNELLPSFPLAEAIPKKLWQIFISDDPLPEALAANVSYLKQLHPQWSYRLFDAAAIEEYIQEHYGTAILGYYQKINPVYRAARADFFRYLLCYREGGVYLDVKSSVYRSLEETLRPEDKYILTHFDNDPETGTMPYFGFSEELELPRGEWVQWSIVSVAGHPFLRAVLLEVMRRIDSYNPFTVDVGLRGVIRTTGPIAFTQAIEAVRPTVRPELYRLIDRPQDVALRYSIFDAAGSFEHKKVLKHNYNIRLEAVVCNGSQYLTTFLRPYFYCRFALRVLRDKWRAYWA